MLLKLALNSWAPETPASAPRVAGTEVPGFTRTFLVTTTAATKPFQFKLEMLLSRHSCFSSCPGEGRAGLYVGLDKRMKQEDEAPHACPPLSPSVLPAIRSALSSSWN